MPDTIKLEFYKYYKQATFGDCNTQRPTFLYFKDDSTNMFQVKYNNKFLYYQVDTSLNFIYNSTMNVVQADGLLYTKKNTLTKTLNIFDTTSDVKENSVEKLIENELNYSNENLVKEKCRTNVRQQYFSNRIVNDWNNLPLKIRSAENVHSFKRQLKMFQGF